ncbi:MAG TPA: hypothetical protein VEY95_08505 [Azospirillaceae bacterium]|nr:hypothetical protein [Azospirillaceae bacterium]
MHRLIVLIVLLSLIAGGGVATWSYLSRETEETTVQADTSSGSPELFYATIPPIMVSVVGEAKAEQFVTLRLSIEVDDLSGLSRVQSVQQRLKNAFIETLYRTFAEEGTVQGAALDLQKVRRRLKNTADDVVGRGVVRQVLILGITQRSL